MHACSNFSKYRRDDGGAAQPRFITVCHYHHHAVPVAPACRYDLIALPGTPLATVGSAYVFVTTAKRLYLSMTFGCNYMFSTAQVMHVLKGWAAILQA